MDAAAAANSIEQARANSRNSLSRASVVVTERAVTVAPGSRQDVSKLTIPVGVKGLNGPATAVLGTAAAICSATAYLAR